MKKEKIYEMNKIATAYFYRQMTEDKQGLDYWQKTRELDVGTIKKYGLGYVPNEWNGLVNHLRSFRDSNNQRLFSDEEMIEAGLANVASNGNLIDKFRYRAMIPICDAENNIIGFGGRTLLTEEEMKEQNLKIKYMNTADTPAFHKGENLFSFNQVLKDPAPQIILCEGYLDVISLNKAGFRTAVASLGTSLTNEQVGLICDNANEVIIAYDNDQAGQNAIRKAIGMFEGTGINVRVWQTDDPTVKDTDAYIKKHGAERMQVLLDNAVDSEIFVIESMIENMKAQPHMKNAEMLIKISDYIMNLDCSDEQKNIYLEHTAGELSISNEFTNIYPNLKYDYTAEAPVFPISNGNGQENIQEMELPF